MPRTTPTDRQIRWQRRFNELIYDSMAPLYDAMDWLTFGAWWRLVRQALGPIPPDGDVLEIGFGPGKLHLEIARKVDRSFGLDLAWGMCRHTKRRLSKAGLPQRLTRGDALHLPFPASSFTTIVSTFTLSGLPDGERALSEMARVLRADGRVVLLGIGIPSDGNWLGTKLARLWESMGDVLYNQRSLISRAELQLATYREFGPGKHIRLIVAHKLSQPDSFSGPA
jgi:ubiquinone/menaquinone biosynthesis C-methylase UbiE